jgi:hypothetical protein
MAEPTSVTVKLDTSEVTKTLFDFRTAMLEELGNEFVAGMEKAFDIAIDSLTKSVNDPRIATSQYGPGVALAVDVLKDVKGEAIKPFIEANRKALNTASNTETETHTGETPNG